MVTLTSTTANAIQKADLMPNELVKVTNHRYEIKGSSGDPYILIILGEIVSCNCQAGLKGRYCWHVEKLRRAIRIEQDRSNIVLARRGNTAIKRVASLKNQLATCDSGFYVRQQIEQELAEALVELDYCKAETQRRREAGTWQRPARYN